MRKPRAVPELLRDSGSISETEDWRWPPEKFLSPRVSALPAGRQPRNKAANRLTDSRVPRSNLPKLQVISLHLVLGPKRSLVGYFGRTLEFDLIMIDCQMPELDGYKATQTIRKREQALDYPDDLRKPPYLNRLQARGCDLDFITEDWQSYASPSGVPA